MLNIIVICALFTLNNYVIVGYTPIIHQLTNQQIYNQSNITQNNIGYWFNKGKHYAYCIESINKQLHNHNNNNNECDKLSIQLTIDKIDLNQINYSNLVKKILCILKQINCPINEKSFQIHDIPCQSSCLSLLAVCGQLRNAPKPFFRNIPSGCPNNLIQTTQKRWIYGNDKLQTTELPVEPTTRIYSTYNNMLTSKRYVRYPDYMNPISSRSLSNNHLHEYYKHFNVKSKYQNEINNNNPWIYHRYSRQANINKDLINNLNQYYTNGAKRSIGYINDYNTNKIQLQFNPVQQNLPLSEEDCLLLPPGGCDKWMDPSTNLQHLKAPSFKEYLKLNSGCPKNVPEMCNEMFPTSYSRSKWIKSNFTVSAVIRISGTLWWFGKTDRYQPLFRFHVLKTFDSDIHPYDEKMILTYSWPLQCICMDEIIVGKKYLMLTHSFKARQTLHITKNTVFLSRVRRYTRKLACWKGACIQKSNRNRRRRYYIQPNIKLLNTES
ncbi:hypothetical protein EWB00_005567 [Schistosoma japonicum]|uniref:Uncharacterized protein n=1 Tax=Schistosoma japonicum TaxID=6182 RepID=A0A4Z2D250_SCHJA|nr:hypothetical protein KSF78_0004495 [Schistosoma japonicum]TNN10240.1 hypothetical protein EWB00_005567 [Schistosoma japonicum]